MHNVCVDFVDIYKYLLVSTRHPVLIQGGILYLVTISKCHMVSLKKHDTFCDIKSLLKVLLS